MNNLQALIKCRNLWQWLVITGDDDKESYKPAKRWPYNCAACMKAGSTKESNRKRNCDNCILLGYAWSNAVRNSVFCESNSEYSYYSYYKVLEWIHHYEKKKHKYYANQIVNACNKAIEDILVYGKLRRNYFSTIKEDS